jgi:hypothetical protein
MRELDLTNARWRKSSHSSGNGQCVEVARLPEAIAVRDSKDPVGPKLIFTRQAWAAFVEQTSGPTGPLADFYPCC